MTPSDQMLTASLAAPLFEAAGCRVVASIVLAGDAGLAYSCPHLLYGPVPASFRRLPKEPNLKVYSGANIRNVAMVGHGHAGKTSLVSAMLYTAGAPPGRGRLDDGSATTDYDEEEIARKMSISTGLAVGEWGAPGNTTKINILDTPGFRM